MSFEGEGILGLGIFNTDIIFLLEGVITGVVVTLSLATLALDVLDAEEENGAQNKASQHPAHNDHG